MRWKCQSSDLWIVVAIFTAVLTNSFATQNQFVVLSKRNTTVFLALHTLAPQQLKDFPEGSDWSAQKELCRNKDWTYNGVKVQLNMLSINDHVEEELIADYLFEYLQNHFKNTKHPYEVVLGATTRGKWIDRSDTSYIKQKALGPDQKSLFEDIMPGNCLYMRVRPADSSRRYEVKSCRTANDYSKLGAADIPVFIVCKGVAKGIIPTRPDQLPKIMADAWYEKYGGRPTTENPLVEPKKNLAEPEKKPSEPEKNPSEPEKNPVESSKKPAEPAKKMAKHGKRPVKWSYPAAVAPKESSRPLKNKGTTWPGTSLLREVLALVAVYFN